MEARLTDLPLFDHAERYTSNTSKQRNTIIDRDYQRDHERDDCDHSHYRVILRVAD